MNFKSCKHQQLSPLLALFLSIGVLLSTDTFAAGVSQAQLAAERNARINADTTLTTNLAAEKNARIAADTAETNARTAADTAEASARQAAIQAAITPLQTQINSSALPPLPPGQFQVSLTRCGNRNTLQWGPCHYAIGDTGPAGGIVFYVTGGGLHGLEAAPVDQDSATWGCFTAPIAGATGSAVGTGAANTAAIVAGCAEPGTAAKVADAYSLNGYDDWFLPSKDELNLMYINIGLGAIAPLTNVGGFANGYYWSSTYNDYNSAWNQYFDSGSQYPLDKDNSLRVRAVRAF